MTSSFRRSGPHLGAGRKLEDAAISEGLVPTWEQVESWRELLHPILDRNENPADLWEALPQVGWSEGIFKGDEIVSSTNCASVWE